MKTFQYKHSAHCDHEKRVIEQTTLGDKHEAQLSKLDGSGHDDDTEDGQQQQLCGEVPSTEGPSVLEHEVANDGNHGHRRDEHTRKQSFVRLNIVSTISGQMFYAVLNITHSHS